MNIEFAGAAREVTGSCHILRINGKTVLLDCGLFQGHRSDAEAKNRSLPCPIEQIDAVVLSHAHLDHSGRLPFLVSHGFSKAIHATKATADLCAIMLADSAHIQESDFAFLSRHGREVEPSSLRGARCRGSGRAHATARIRRVVRRLRRYARAISGCGPHSRLGVRGDRSCHGIEDLSSRSSRETLDARVSRSSVIRCRRPMPLTS